MNKRRKRPSQKVETDVLTLSARRCCLCFGFEHDVSVKAGQIAHIDGNPNNSKLDNLVWLCLEHHDQLDSKTSQSKGITKDEVKYYRGQLYRYIQQQTNRVTTLQEVNTSRKTLRGDRKIFEKIDEYYSVPPEEYKILFSEIVLRFRKYVACNNALVGGSPHYKAFDDIETSDELKEWEKAVVIWREEQKSKYNIPLGIYDGKLGDRIISEESAEYVENLIHKWVEGSFSEEEQASLWVVLEEFYDCDQFYILYNFPIDLLNEHEVTLFEFYTVEFGRRNRFKPNK